MYTARRNAIRIALVGVLALGACTPAGQDPEPRTPTASQLVGLRSPSARPPNYSMYVSVPSRAESYSTTFGFVVCSLRPDARITGVKPTKTVGSGFAVREIRLATFHLKDGFTLASPGFPPKPRPDDRFEPVVGSSPHTCSDPDLHSEVQIGIRKTSEDGGGWRGALVE